MADLDRTHDDPYACAVCNCHHHTTEQHGIAAFDLRDDFDWDDDRG